MSACAAATQRLATADAAQTAAGRGSGRQTAENNFKDCDEET